MEPPCGEPVADIPAKPPSSSNFVPSTVLIFPLDMLVAEPKLPLSARDKAVKTKKLFKIKNSEIK